MADTAPLKKLTKKQLKATAFRSKKKIKDLINDRILSIPEEDGDEEQLDPGQRRSQKSKAAPQGSSSLPAKKRKRSQSTEPIRSPDDPESDSELIPSETTASKRRKRKKAQKLREQKENEEKKSSKLILFVGNLPFDISSERLKSFFSQHCDEEPTVRLMTTKTTDQTNRGSERPRTKGCGFIEFKTAAALQKALRLHHSPISSEPDSSHQSAETNYPKGKTRKINIELTAGGGGKSENRMKKIHQSQLRLSKQRDKLLERKIKSTSIQKALNADKETVDAQIDDASEYDVTVKFGGRHRKNHDPNHQTSRAHHSQPLKPKLRPPMSGPNSIRLG